MMKKLEAEYNYSSVTFKVENLSNSSYADIDTIKELVNNVPKDDKNFYINNNENSLQIDIEFITNEEKKETTTYKMEQIENLGTTEFIKNFNTALFKCTEKNYHKNTGKIAYIKLLQKEG